MSHFFMLISFFIHTLGHCYLMMDDLQKAYNAYQQALYHLPNPKVSFYHNLFEIVLLLLFLFYFINEF